MPELPLTKSLQGNCVALLKYLILLFFRNRCTWAPNKQAGPNQGPTGLVSAVLLRAVTTGEEVAGDGARWRCGGAEVS